MTPRPVTDRERVRVLLLLGCPSKREGHWMIQKMDATGLARLDRLCIEARGDVERMSQIKAARAASKGIPDVK